MSADFLGADFLADLCADFLGADFLADLGADVLGADFLADLGAFAAFTSASFFAFAITQKMCAARAGYTAARRPGACAEGWSCRCKNAAWTTSGGSGTSGEIADAESTPKPT